MANSTEAELRRQLFQLEMKQIIMLAANREDRIRSGLEVMEGLVDSVAAINRSPEIMAKAAELSLAFNAAAAQLIVMARRQETGLKLAANDRYRGLQDG